MGQELGRALVNLGKPAEVVADEDVEPCPYTAEGQGEFNIPTQNCEIQQCWNEDQRTGGPEEGKEKTGACSEFVVLQTDDSKLAQILKTKENSKQNSTTKHATNSVITGHCNQESLLQNGVCITTDPLDLNGSTSNCKPVQSECGDEGIQNNGAKELIKNNKSEGSTKNEVKRKRKLRSIVILKNEPVRTCRKEQEWNNWEEGRQRHKKQKSRSNSKSSGARDSGRRRSRERSIDYQRHTTKYEENIRCRTSPSCIKIQNHSHSDMCSIKSQENLLRSSWSSSRSPEVKTTLARSQYTIDAKRQWQGRDRDKEQVTEKEFDRYSKVMNYHRRQVADYDDHLNLDKVHRKQNSHKRSFSGSDTESSKNGRRSLRRHRKTGSKSGSSAHDFYAYENRNHDRFVRRRSTSESSCFTVESSECYEWHRQSDGKQKIQNLGDESRRKRSLEVDRLSSNRRKADQVCYRLDEKVLKKRNKQKTHKLHLASQSKSVGSKYSSEVTSSPHLKCTIKEEIKKISKKHQKDICFQKDKIDQRGNSCHVGNDVTESSSDNACARFNNASVTNIPVLAAMPPVPQKPPVPPPIQTKSLSSTFSPDNLNHLVEKLGIQVCSGRFGMEKQDLMQVGLPDNRKFYEVPHQMKHTLSTSFEDAKVTNRASNQLPNMFDLQMQLLNLSKALSLALPPVAPLASKVPLSLQQDILHQLLSASAFIPPQRPQSSGISTWYKPLSEWDAPSPCSDDLVSFSPPLSQDIDSCKEVNKERGKHKNSSNDFGQQTFMKKNSTKKKLENSGRLKKTEDAVKEVVLPLYSERKITKDEYKQVMRVVVPKIFHCKTEFSRELIERHVQICVNDVLVHKGTSMEGIDL